MTHRWISALTAVVAATVALSAPIRATPAAPSFPPPTRAIVLVISSAGRDSGRTRPGFEMDELSQAWLIFTRNGYRVTIASPSGGAVQADRFDPASDYNAAFLADTAATRALNQTLPTSALRASDYDAVFVIGGKGAMFDLPGDMALARFVGQLHDRGSVVAAVCHGPAGLMRVRTRDGKSLMAGRAVTGFTNEEETVFGKKWVAQYPFSLEDEARALGARWEEAPLMLPRVAIDGRLITGQNPFSTPATAEAVVTALGATPAPRAPWKEERSIALAAAALESDAVTPRRELARMHSELQVDLIGLLGYYQLQVASDDVGVRRALTLMELAAPYMPQPEISVGLADAYHRTGRTTEARHLLRAVLQQKPEMAAAKALLAKLGT